MTERTGMTEVLDRSAVAAVVGATDAGSTIDFLGVFGLVAGNPVALDRERTGALYGLDAPTTEVELRTPGAAVPGVVVAGCDDPGELPEGFQRGPRALDIYTSDMDAAVDHLHFVGLSPGPVGTVAVGPVTMRQCLVPGPDGLAVVLVESSHRRASLLDESADRLFSEGHSVVWCVGDMDSEAETLASLGAHKGMDLSFCEPEVSTYLDLPRSPVPMRMTMLSGPGVEPLRLELLEFPEDPAAEPTLRHLTGGIWALRHEVGDPAVLATELAGNGWRIRGESEAAACVESHGGVRLQLVR